ncbi:MAG: hypothetical protein ABIG39_01595 [Candidatus Micrarchaeota archaeon]
MREYHSRALIGVLLILVSLSYAQPVPDYDAILLHVAGQSSVNCVMEGENAICCDGGICCYYMSGELTQCCDDAINVCCFPDGTCCDFSSGGPVCCHVGVGASCWMYDECCGSDLTCVDGTCCIIDGEECDINGPSTQCCNGICSTDGICETPERGCGEVGEDCSSRNCCEGLTCETETNTCCATLGGDCNTTDDCCGANTCDGGTCNFPEGCTEIGQACSLDDECCSGNCENDVCAISLVPTCTEDAGFCNFDEDCCSNNCLNSVCSLPDSSTDCKSYGSACTEHSDCCSWNCVNSKCGQAMGCTPVGQECLSGLECCSGLCKELVCSTGKTCKYLSEECSSDEECCSGKCTESVCSLEVETCVGMGIGCVHDVDCCEGNCINNVCTTDCKINGADCASPAECCSGSCKNYICAPPLECRESGDGCSYTYECCSGMLCTNHKCKVPQECNSIGEGCYLDAECCSGRCKGGICSEYVKIVSIKIKGDTSFAVGGKGVLKACARYETGEEEEIPVAWSLDGMIGELSSGEGKDVIFSASMGGGGVVRINYRDEKKTFTNILPISVKAIVTRIDIFSKKIVLYHGEAVHFAVRGYDSYGNMIGIDPGDVIWGADSGIIDGNGNFVAPEEDTNVTVTAAYGDFTARTKLQVIPVSGSGEEESVGLDALIAALIGKEMDKVYAIIGQLVLAILAGLLVLFLLIYAAKKVKDRMARKFELPDIPPGCSVIIEAPLESAAERSVYRILNEEIEKEGGKAVVLSLKPEETLATLDKNLRRVDNVRVIGVDANLTKVGIRLSELIESEKPTVVYFPFFSKAVLMEEVDAVADFIEFNVLKLVTGKIIGIFPVELNEKLTSEFLSKLEVGVDMVIEHRVTDKEYARVKQWKEGGFGKEWLPFR